MVKLGVFALALAAVLLSACSVKQDVLLSADAGGTTTMEVQLDEVLTSYFRDLAASVGAESRGGVFDPAAIRESFAQRPGVTARRVEVTEENTLHLVLAFSDIAELVASEDDAVQQLVDVSNDAGVTTVVFHITPQTVRDALRLSPLYGSDAAAYLLPGEGSNISASQYSEQLAWALEEYAEERPIAEIIRSSSIRLNVAVKGELVSQRGGSRLSESTVQFVLPIVELLTVQEERRYEVRFR